MYLSYNGQDIYWVMLGQTPQRIHLRVAICARSFKLMLLLLLHCLLPCPALSHVAHPPVAPCPSLLVRTSPISDTMATVPYCLQVIHPPICDTPTGLHAWVRSVRNARGRDAPSASGGHMYLTCRIDVSQWNMRCESSLHVVVSPGDGTRGATHDAVCSGMDTLPLAKPAGTGVKRRDSECASQLQGMPSEETCYS